MELFQQILLLIVIAGLALYLFLEVEYSESGAIYFLAEMKTD
jgi:hypothetical protein